MILGKEVFTTIFRKVKDERHERIASGTEGDASLGDRTQ